MRLLDIVSSKNIKRTFLSSEQLPDVYSKNLFYGNKVSYDTSLSGEFHDCQPISLGVGVGVGFKADSLTRDLGL